MLDSNDDIPPEIQNADRGPGIMAAILAGTIVATLFSIARLYVRGRILGKFHTDDWFIILAVLCAWAAVALGIVAVDYGNGQHLETLSQSQQENVTFYTLVGFPFGILSFGLPKLAVVALLTRIMNPSRWHKIFLWTMTIVCNVVLVINVVFLLARCQPAESLWNFDIEGTCWDPWVLVTYAVVSGAFSAFVDLYLAVYPAFVLAKLKINVKKKIALTVALGIGCMSTGVAIYKCTRLPSLASENFSWDSADLLIWNITEGSIIIVAACIPVLQPVFDIVLGKRAFSSYGNRYGNGYGNGYASGGQNHRHRHYAPTGGGRVGAGASAQAPNAANYSVDIKSAGGALRPPSAGDVGSPVNGGGKHAHLREDSSDTLTQTASASDEEAGMARIYGVQFEDEKGRARGGVQGRNRSVSGRRGISRSASGGGNGNRSRSGTAHGHTTTPGGRARGRSSTEDSYEMHVTGAAVAPLRRESQDGILGADDPGGVPVPGNGPRRQQSAEILNMNWPMGVAGIVRTDEISVSFEDRNGPAGGRRI